MTYVQCIVHKYDCGGQHFFKTYGLQLLFMGLCFIWYKNNAAAFFSMHVHACPLFQEGVNETLSSNSSEKQDAQNEH